MTVYVHIYIDPKAMTQFQYQKAALECIIMSIIEKRESIKLSLFSNWRRTRRRRSKAWNQELTINKNLYREMSTALQFHLHFISCILISYLFLGSVLFISNVHLNEFLLLLVPSFFFSLIYIFWSCNLLPCNLYTFYYLLHDVFSPMKWGRWWPKRRNWH